MDRCYLNVYVRFLHHRSPLEVVVSDNASVDQSDKLLESGGVCWVFGIGPAQALFGDAPRAFHPTAKDLGYG